MDQRDYATAQLDTRDGNSSRERGAESETEPAHTLVCVSKSHGCLLRALFAATVRSISLFLRNFLRHDPTNSFTLTPLMERVRFRNAPFALLADEGLSGV